MMKAKPEAKKSAPGEENRRAPRQRALKAAKAVLSDWSTIDCIIRDLNDEGARLEFAGPVSLPEEFRLISVVNKTARPVRLLWQRALFAGVAFTGPEESAPRRS